MMVMISAVVVIVSLFAGVAFANNTHTTNGEWWNGLGDGKDKDGYVHSFTHSRYGHAHPNYADVRFAGYLDGYDRCNCDHAHVNMRTYTFYECPKASSGNDADGHNNINFHYHYHHFKQYGC